MTISEIVPVYNAEKYLGKCLDSILEQTYKKIEIILVDDGSTDNSPKILDQYAAKDSRIRVIHKANGGAASARNAGLRAAEGEYVGFTDSDDWIEPFYVEQLVHACKNTEADIVVSDHFHDIGQESKRVSGFFPLGLYNKEQLLSSLLYSGRFFEYGLQPHLVTKLFRKDILLKTQLCVDERIVIGEDAAVVYPTVLEAEKIFISDICGYHYVQHSGSITKSETLDEKEWNQLLFDYLESVFREKGVWNIMEPQLKQYKKYLLFMRNMSEFDTKVLLPYGGISKTSKVVIYGAGVLGQKMYKYLSGIEDMDIVLWVDKNCMVYRDKGMNVNKPADILSLQEYDYILIAHTVQQTAETIRRDLVDMGIADNRILWFTKEFVEQEG